MYIDRRKSTRTNSNYRVKITTPTDKSHSGRVKNMSSDGIFVLMDSVNELATGMLVEVKILECDGRQSLPGLPMEVVRTDELFAAFRYFDQAYNLEMLFSTRNTCNAHTVDN